MESPLKDSKPDVCVCVCLKWEVVHLRRTIFENDFLSGKLIFFFCNAFIVSINHYIFYNDIIISQH